MATIVTRSGKGSPLTHAEVDANFTNLNTDKLELSGGTMTGNLSFGDNDKAIFGAGSDLQIFHDPDASSGEGSVGSYIKEGGTGDLRIRASNLQLQSSGGERYMTGTENGAATLFYDDASKLATTSTGVNITGTLTSDGLTVNGGYLTVDNGYGITTVGGLKYIADSDDNAPSAGLLHQFFTDNGTTKAATISKGGDISFYEDTGTTAKFFWDASAESLGIGTTSPSALVDISKSGTGDYSTLKLSNTGASGRKYELGVGGSGTGNYAGKFYVYDSTAGQPRFSLDSSGNVGIGTISPDNSLHISYTDSTAYSDATHDAGIQIENTDTTTNSFSQLHFRTGNSDSYIRNIREGDNLASLAFLTDDGGVTGDVGEAMRIDSSGRVGIGTSSPAYALDVQDDDATRHLRVFRNASGTSAIMVQNADTGSGSNDGLQISVLNGGDAQIANLENTNLRFLTNSTERMRIDSSGNLLVGQTTASSTDVGVSARSNGVLIATADGSNSALFNRKTSDGDIAVFRKDGTSVGSIGTEGGDLTVGKAGSGLQFRSADPCVRPHNMTTNSPSDAAVDLGRSNTRFKDLYLSGGLRGNTTFKNNAGTTEYARFDSSGNLLVGVTSDTDSTNVGVRAKADGFLGATRAGSSTQPTAYFNKKTNDGVIAGFYKDGTAVGSIATETGDLIIHSTAASHAGLRFGNTRLQPADNTGTTVDDAIDIGITTSRFKDLYLSGGLRGEPTFKNNAGTTEYARFDSSGNFLVGKTASSLANDGFQVHNTGYIGSTNSGAATAYFNRKTNDGDIVNFQKDGSTVGTIGTYSSDFYIGNPDESLIRFGNEQIVPAYNSGSDRDNAIDLGGSGGRRFRDLFLGGGVYLGGTGAANKLDDYEEGTWTPVLKFGGYTTGIVTVRAEGKYTKIGNVVHIIGHFLLSSKGTASGHAEVSGLPFTCNSNTNGAFTPLGDRGNLNTGGENVSAYLQNSASVYLYRGGFDGGSNETVTNTHFENTTEIDLNFSYIAS